MKKKRSTIKRCTTNLFVKHRSHVMSAFSFASEVKNEVYGSKLVVFTLHVGIFKNWTAKIEEKCKRNVMCKCTLNATSFIIRRCMD